MSILEVQDIKKSFKSKEAVKGCSFKVEQGEVFGFLGPNGAGKSTTIKMLCTMLRPSHGTALINGYDIVKERNHVRESIGVIFQESTLDLKLTAYENLQFHCRIYNIKKAERDIRIMDALLVVDLLDRRKDKVSTFSGGMKRRLEIARGLLNYPKILFLDEPTVGLDPQTRAYIWDYILKLRREKQITIFLTTHYMDEAEYCDRIAIIDNGKINIIETPNVLKESIGGDVIEIVTSDNNTAKQVLEGNFNKIAKEYDGVLSFKVSNGTEYLVYLIKNFPIEIKSVNLRRPTLNDVFLDITGKDIRN